MTKVTGRRCSACFWSPTPGRRSRQQSSNQPPTPNRPLKNVGEAGKTRQKRPKKRSLRVVNEHFEAVFNAVLPTQVVFQLPVKDCARYDRRTEPSRSEEHTS